MKKDIEWLKNEIGTEMIQLEPNRKERWSDVKYQTLRSVAQKINQLDEREVLSQEWIDKNVVHVRGLGDIIEAAAVENLLVPKKEVLSQEWIDKHTYYEDEYDFYYADPDELKNLLVPKQAELEAKIQELIETYKQEDGQYSNPENGWIGGFIEDLKNLLEEQQKYYVLDTEDIPMLVKSHGAVNRANTHLSIHEKRRNTEHYQLTEQEIKDYDPRYMTFAVPVEEDK